MAIVIRSDDLDFRLTLDGYRSAHDEFIKRDLIETVALQFANNHHVARFDPDVIEYFRTTPNYDFQLHGWQHEKYDDMTYFETVRDMAASIHFCQKLFNKTPTIWFPPWNCRSTEMEQAATFLDLKIDNESYDIAKFIREAEAGMYLGHSFYYHIWNKDERILLEKALDWVLTINKQNDKITENKA